MGGGFYAYLDNKEQLHRYTKGEEKFESNPSGKAFHSIIFEVLGEHGYVGLGIFLAMLGGTNIMLWRVIKKNYFNE